MPKKRPEIPPLKRLQFRKTLSMPSLLKNVFAHFNNIEEHRTKKPTYPLSETLMTGLAIFGLKYPSLLAFDNDREEKRIRHNLQSLYGIKKAPSDTSLREVLDKVTPESLRPATVGLIQECQKQGVLENYRFLGGYLCSIDGTGQYSSQHISCPDCCEKKHRDGSVEYYHQLLASVLVHPDKKQVLPLFSEAIKKKDGQTKNDCERNAAKRLLPAIKKGFPRLKLIVLEDALAANAPHLKTLEDNGMSYIIRVKYGSNKSLIDHAIKCMSAGETEEFEETGDDSIIRGYRFINSLPLTKASPEQRVNYLEYWEVNKNGKNKNFSWISDITLSRDNVHDVMRAGRSRWKVENETFNTLKNLGYHFEHNYGHGKKHLTTVFATLMMLAFLIDQIQEVSCTVFRAARHRYHSKTSFWGKLKGLFTEHYIEDWKTCYLAIIYDHKSTTLQVDYPDTS